MLETMFVPEAFNEETLAKAKQLRTRIDIPDELDTVFFIARFLRALDGDVEMTKLRIEEYLTHRKCLEYGNMDPLAVFTKSLIGRDTFERFGISLLQSETTSKNVHVWIHKMVDTDLKEIMKVIPLSNVIHSYFMLQDLFGRYVAATEKSTGKQSSVCCVLDLDGFNISDFLNPLSAPVKLARLVVQVWAEYFSENMGKLVIINPPALINIMWKISKWILDARTQNRLIILSTGQDLLQHLEPQVVPVDYGGTRKDDTGFANPATSCCQQPRPVSPSEYREPDAIWKENGMSKPACKSYHVKGKSSVDIIRTTDESGLLIWQFTTGSDVQFEIVKKGDKEEHLWPKIAITSLKLPEYGSVRVEKGEYLLRFTNPASTWLPVKVQCSVEIVPQ